MAIKKLCPFKLWTLQNFPFIAEDFDALTNYELMCKIVEYLNNVIDITNEQTTAINELKNWFDNLDVQDEINNKLDEMAESGQLQEIITSYLQVNGVLSFNTLNDLINATNIIDGSTCKTLGLNSYNDGKGEFYKIRTITNDDVVDNLNIIALNISNTLIAEKLPNYFINDLYANKTNIDELHQKRLQSNYYTTGMRENGVAIYTRVNSEGRPPVMGLNYPYETATYSDRDCVAIQGIIRPNVPILDYNNNDAIYSNLYVECPTLSSEEKNKLKNTDFTNIIIDTYDVSNQSYSRFSSFIDYFDEENNRIYVQNGWYGVGTDGSSTYIPSNGLNFRIGISTKIWGTNIVAQVPTDSSTCKSASVEELELNGNKEMPSSKIIDAIGSGSYGSRYGIVTRGKIRFSNTVIDGDDTVQRAYYAFFPNPTHDKYLLITDTQANANPFFITSLFELSHLKSYVDRGTTNAFAFIHLSTTSNTNENFVNATRSNSGSIQILFNVSMSVNKTFTYTNYNNQTKTFNVPANTVVILMNIDGTWYKISSQTASTN